MESENRDIVVVVVGRNPPRRLDKALAEFAPEKSGLSRSRIAKLIREGEVSRGGEPELNPDCMTETGQRWTIRLARAGPAEVRPQSIDLDIRYEDDELIVIDKPPGLVVHPAAGNRQGTLLNGLLNHCERLSQVRGAQLAGIVHRLDKDTSGLIVAAKTEMSHLALARQFADHTVNRKYAAVVRGLPGKASSMLGRREGSSIEGGGVFRMEGNVGRSDRDRKKMAVKLMGGKWAVTRARVEEYFPGANAALLECWLETGRTHQIRVHLSHFGHPLVGDQTYGRRRLASMAATGSKSPHERFAIARQALHAGTLGFTHPRTLKPMQFDSEFPADMAQLVESLRSCGSPGR